MNLKELEARLQSLIEIDLPSIIPGKQVEDVLIQKLAVAIHANTVKAEDNSLLAPNIYTIVLHPRSAEKWQDQQLLTVLLHSISSVAQEAGFRFIMAPTITLSTNENLSTS